MYIKMTRIRRRKSKISEAEFELTSQFLHMLDLDVDSDFTIYSDLYLDPLMCGSKYLGFAERFSSISKIPKELAIFRPFRNEKHANIIIELFEEFNYIDFDTLEINDYEKDGKIKYSGWLTKDGQVVEGSYIKTSPSAAILKMSIIAALMMDADEHKQYMENLMTFLKRGDNNEPIEETV